MDCSGHHRYSSRGTGYYPADDPIEGGFLDRQGHPLRTLQVRMFFVIRMVNTKHVWDKQM